MQSLLECLGVPDRPTKKFNCPSCGKWLQFDTGVWENGLPSAWAFCSPRRGGCGKTWCPHLDEMTTVKTYSLGTTNAGADKDVPTCAAGSCGRKRVRYEAILAEFTDHASSAKAWEYFTELDERSRKGSMSWERQEAIWLLRVRHYFREIRREALIAKNSVVSAAPAGKRTPTSMTVDDILARATESA